ncbi:hypothetical protein MMC31_006064 [Peltigera leucophlebia]|nr:hypothetical protein [Peltigera leucophlebia]
MTKKEDSTPTRTLNPDPKLRTTTPPDTFEKKQKKSELKLSVATEAILAKTSNLPNPNPWAEAGMEDCLLVSMHIQGLDWFIWEQ